VRAWNVQMSLALDRLYPNVEMPPPAPALPKPADDWRKTKLPGGIDEDGLHDGSSAFGRIAAFVIAAGILALAVMFMRDRLKDQDPRASDYPNGSTGEYVEGRTSFASVGLSIDFGSGFWRHHDTDENSVLFVKPGQGEALGYLRVWRRVGEAPEDTDALIEALKAEKWGGDVETTTTGCEVSDLHEPPAIECHWPGWHYYAWVVDGDMIGVRYDEKYLCKVCKDELPDIVSSVRPL